MNRFHGVPFRFYATSCAREALEAKVPNPLFRERWSSLTQNDQGNVQMPNVAFRLLFIVGFIIISFAKAVILFRE